jgi:group I intron endonuclease
VAHKNRTCGIYTITSPSNKMYIGQSINIEKRLQTHKSMLRGGRHPNVRLQGACNRYGLNELQFSIAEACPEEQLDAREQWWIDSHNSQYNMSRNAANPANDPAVRARITKTKQANAQLISKTSREMWARAGFREARKDNFANTRNASDAYRDACSARFKQLWANPDFRKKATQKTPARVAAIERLVENHRAKAKTDEYKEKMRSIAAERRQKNGPTKREIDFARRSRIGSSELSKKRSDGLTKQHSDARYSKAVQEGLILYTTRGLAAVFSQARKDAYPSQVIETKGRVARSIIRNG